MRLFWVLISGLFFSSCSQGKQSQNMDNSKHDGKTKDSTIQVKSDAYKPQLGSCAFSLISDIIEGVNGTYSCDFYKKSYKFYLQNPQNNRGKLLVLFPGWNYPVMDWKHNTGVVDSALQWGFQVLLCDMGKSVYMDSVYPEARGDYKGFATRTWLWDSVLSPVSKQIGMGNMVLMGLSTGARGAILLGMEHQNEVGGVIALSGDYVPTLDTTDALMRNSLGPFYNNPKRWEEGDNNIYNIDGLPNFVFIAHGEKDKIVPIQHSRCLNEHLGFLKTTETLIFREEQGAHDYQFWGKWGLVGLRSAVSEQ